MRSARVVLVSLVAAASALAAFPLYLGLRSEGSKIFAPEPFDFALLSAATFALTLGAQIALLSSVRYITLVAVLAGAALLFGVLAIFSIGIAFLPAGLVFVLLLYRALRRRPSSVATTRAALGGAAIGYSIPLLYIALIIPATVECFPQGAGTASGRWQRSSGFQSHAGGIRVTPDGVVTGQIDSDDAVITFRCEQGRIVEFHRSPR